MKRNGWELSLDVSEEAHIVVVDDDPEILDVVGEYLGEEGYRVSTVTSGADMRRILKEGPVDLVILDVRLAGENGFDLAQEIRQENDAGIIMLSRKDDVVDRVAGLEVGADDYIAKPFHLREVLARTRSVLRRRESGARESGAGTPETPTERSGNRYLFGRWQLDARSRILLSPDAEPVELSSGEFDLLLAFLKHPKQTLSRDRLLDLTRGVRAAQFDRSIDVQVGRLRRKIEADPPRPAIIKTVRGAGYKFSLDVELR